MIILCNFHFGPHEKEKTSWGWTVATKDLLADWVTVLCFENWIKKNQHVNISVWLLSRKMKHSESKQQANKNKLQGVGIWPIQNFQDKESLSWIFNHKQSDQTLDRDVLNFAHVISRNHLVTVFFLPKNHIKIWKWRKTPFFKEVKN